MQKFTFEVRGFVFVSLQFLISFLKLFLLYTAFFVISITECINVHIISHLIRRLHLFQKPKHSRTFFILKSVIELFLNLIGCMPGYGGENCSSLCPYPYYGLHCQRRCNCSREFCDVSSGCIRIVTGGYKNKFGV